MTTQAYTPENFVDQVGPVVPAQWLNRVDKTVLGVLQSSTTVADVLTILGLTGFTSPLPVTAGGTGGTSAATGVVGLGIGVTTAAETAAGLTVTAPQYPVGNVLRYGIYPLTSSATSPQIATARANNGPIFQTLVSATVAGGPSGLMVFPSVLGGDIYYLDARQYLFRDGIRLDLQGNTLNLSSGTLANNAPFFMAIRNLTIENGSVTITYTGSHSEGYFLRFGSRYGDGLGWPGYANGILDQDDLAANSLPLQGGLTLRNLRISSNNPAQAIIVLIGGLRDIDIRNCWFDGVGGLSAGAIYYEFGFASLNGQPGNQSLWTSSHAVNMIWENLVATNMSTTAGKVSFEARGAAELQCKNIFVNGGYTGISFSSGEAYYFRMWSQDGAGGGGTVVVPRQIAVKGFVGVGLTIGIAAGGAGPVAGYLSSLIGALSTPTQWQAQTDLLSFEVDGFRVHTVGTGVEFAGGASMEIKNGVIYGDGVTSSSGGIYCAPDSQRLVVNNVQISNINGPAIRFDGVSTIWSPVRRTFCHITNCTITSCVTGISLNYVASGLVENNQIGANTAFNTVAESVMTTGATVGANNYNYAIRFRNNFTSVAGGGTSYVCTGSSYQTIDSERNAYTTSGFWATYQPKANSGYGTPINPTIISSIDGSHTYTVVNLAAQIAALELALISQGIITA